MIFSHRASLLLRKHSNLFSTAEQIVRREQKAEDQHNAPEKILNKQPRQYSYRNPENGVTDQSSHILSRPFFIFYDDAELRELLRSGAIRKHQLGAKYLLPLISFYAFARGIFTIHFATFS